MSGKEQFGTWLRFLRKKSGLKQYELAERINIDPTLISRYECGTAMPALETIDLFANLSNKFIVLKVIYATNQIHS